MATGVASWSQTAASNASADSNVNLAEGMAPSGLNDAARAMMASVAKWRDDISGSLVTGGSANAHTLTTNQGFASLSALDGQMLSFRAGFSNSAAATLAVDGLTAKNIARTSGVNVASGDIIAGRVYTVTYNATAGNFILHDYTVP